MARRIFLLTGLVLAVGLLLSPLAAQAQDATLPPNREASTSRTDNKLLAADGAEALANTAAEEAAIGQNRAHSWSPEWTGEENLMRHIDRYTGDTLMLHAQACTDCGWDPILPNLPVYIHTIPVPRGQELQLSSIEHPDPLELPSTRFQELTHLLERLLQPDQDWYPAQPVQLLGYTKRQGQRYAQLAYYPLQVHRSGANLREHLELRAAYTLATPPPTPETAAFAPGSYKTSQTTTPLAEGQWYKLAVPQTGVYSIGHAELNELGLTPDNLNPNNVAVYGIPGGMLLQPNTYSEMGDLRQLPSWMPGAADGQWSGGERLYFYAEGADLVRYLPNEDRLYKEENLYADTAYVFLRVDAPNVSRVTPLSGLDAPTGVLSNSRALSSYHEDKISLIKMGRVFLGDRFDVTNSRSYNLPLPNWDGSAPPSLRVQAAARHFSQSTMTVEAGGAALGQLRFTPANTSCTHCRYALFDVQTYTAPTSGASLPVTLTYQRPSSATAWLDYLEAEYPASFGPNPSLVHHFITSNPGVYALNGAAANLQAWLVSDPHNVQQLPLEGGAWLLPNQGHSRAVVFDPNTTLRPLPAGPVPNQNLHSLPQADYVIVTHPELLPAAERLAELHRENSGYTTALYTTDKIYNEFSGGRMDVTAIRNLMRHLWTRAASPEERPKFLNLFGEASYDYRGRMSLPPRVPNYQARESYYLPEAYCSDDYFVLMDEEEGLWGENDAFFNTAIFDPLDSLQQTAPDLDLAVGRLPAQSLEEAQVLVDKIESYLNLSDSRGPWRNNILLAADYKTGEVGHMRRSDELQRYEISNHGACKHVEKVYLDNYPAEYLAQGMRFPQAREEFLGRLNRGQLVVNYTGHGGETGLSNARLLEIPDINGLKNGDKLPLWVTATCEFGRHDDPDRRSGAEYVVLNNQGGAIGIITSVRQVFANANQEFNLAFFDHVFRYNEAADRYRTFGEIFMLSKNASLRPSSPINNRNFGLLGDPGLVIAIPNYQAAITAINGQTVTTSVDTFKALQRVTVAGEVQDRFGARLSNFTGEVVLTVYDKPQQQVTNLAKLEFETQNSKLFNGRASVTNGEFELSFTVPLDISYSAGVGKISLYASGEMNGQGVDAAGCNRDFVVCCTDENANFDSDPPVVDLNLNDSAWVDGGTTDPNPSLVALVADDMGINTTGLGIGRELLAYLDGDLSQPLVLNEYYEAALDDPTRGVITYPFENLEPGEHTLAIRVWDVTNKQATDTTTFIVSDNPQTALQQVLSYPNPFNPETQGQTHVMFAHNRADQPLDLEVTILNTQGQMVRTVTSRLTPDGNLTEAMQWDGADRDGNPVAPGVYIFRVKAQPAAGGQAAVRFSRIVLIR